jgi:hypothetical protein
MKTTFNDVLDALIVNANRDWADGAPPELEFHAIYCLLNEAVKESKTREAVKEAYRGAGYFGLHWCMDDIIGRAADRGRDLTQEQAEAIADDIESSGDCVVGINWDTIDYYINLEP